MAVKLVAVAVVVAVVDIVAVVAVQELVTAPAQPENHGNISSTYISNSCNWSTYTVNTKNQLKQNLIRPHLPVAHEVVFPVVLAFLKREDTELLEVQ